jgi:hypothetical protein
MGVWEHAIRRTRRDRSTPPKPAEHRPSGRAALHASHTRVTVTIGAAGAALVVAALAVAPGWPVYGATVAGIVTGCVVAVWPRR